MCVQPRGGMRASSTRHAAEAVLQSNQESHQAAHGLVYTVWMALSVSMMPSLAHREPALLALHAALLQYMAMVQLDLVPVDAPFVLDVGRPDISRHFGQRCQTFVACHSLKSDGPLLLPASAVRSIEMSLLCKNAVRVTEVRRSDS